MMTLGKILSITEITDMVLGDKGVFEHLNIDSCSDDDYERYCIERYDGYKITTETHDFYILINNDQNCCERWGYFYLNDDEQMFIGATLREINLTDTALNKKKAEESGYYDCDDCGGIQFIDFITNKGVLQFAVYNAHNGYYGHPIIFAKDEEIFHQATL